MRDFHYCSDLDRGGSYTVPWSIDLNIGWLVDSCGTHAQPRSLLHDLYMASSDQALQFHCSPLDRERVSREDGYYESIAS